MNFKHGLNNHPLHLSWARMRGRCLNKNNPKYHRYGGRGVKICQEWLNDFKSYYNWATENGWKPGLQVDKDYLGDGLLYSPTTCIIVSNKENCNRRSTTRLVTLNGVTKSVMQWCEWYGINQSTFYSRINTGWDFEIALKTPKQNTKIRYENKHNNPSL